MSLHYKVGDVIRLRETLGCLFNGVIREYKVIGVGSPNRIVKESGAQGYMVISKQSSGDWSTSSGWMGEGYVQDHEEKI